MCARPVHLAIIHKNYLDAVLRGEKSVEARIARVRCAPFGRVERGDVIYLKQTGGPVLAFATARRVRTYRDMTPGDLRALRVEWNDRICGSSEFWAERHGCRYATLIELVDINSTVSPSLRRRLLDWVPRGSRSGWHVIERDAARRAA